MYGDRIIDFLLSANCCVLNGSTKDDYQSVSIKGLAVVDYCLAPYDMLSDISDFNVIRARQLFCDSGGVGFLDPSHILPHHSLLTWKLTLVWPGDSISTSENKKTTQFTQCSRDIPVNFLQGEYVISEIDLKCNGLRMLKFHKAMWMVYMVNFVIRLRKKRNASWTIKLSLLWTQYYSYNLAERNYKHSNKG